MLDLPKILMEQCGQNTGASAKKHAQDSALQKGHKHSACLKTGQIPLQIRAQTNHGIKRDQANGIITDAFPKDDREQIGILLPINQRQRCNGIGTNLNHRNMNDVAKVPVITVHDILTILNPTKPAVQIYHNRDPNANKQNCPKEPESHNVTNIFEKEFLTHRETFFENDERQL